MAVKRERGATGGREAAASIASPPWHLGTTEVESNLAGFEFGMLGLQAAFERYVGQLSRLVGDPELGFNEVVILHVIRMHDQAKDAATIARLLNRDDLPNVQYTLRKLVALGLISKARVGTGATFSATDDGVRWTDRFAALRSRLLSDQLDVGEIFDEGALEALGGRLAMLTGVYETATRAACILNPHGIFADAEA